MEKKIRVVEEQKASSIHKIALPYFHRWTENAVGGKVLHSHFLSFFFIFLAFLAASHWRVSSDEDMSTLVIPSPAPSPRDDATQLHRAFKGFLFSFFPVTVFWLIAQFFQFHCVLWVDLDYQLIIRAWAFSNCLFVTISLCFSFNVVFSIFLSPYSK